MVCVWQLSMVPPQQLVPVSVFVRNTWRAQQESGKRVAVRMLVMQIVFVQVLMLQRNI